MPVMGVASGGPPVSSWQDDILNALQAPATVNNVNKLTAWNICEQGHNGVQYNNPFNTTQPAAGASVINSAGVKAYPNWQTGLTATVTTLLAPLHGYSAIRKNLLSDGPPAEFANAVGSSQWGTNGSCIASTLSSGKALTSEGPSGGGSSSSASCCGHAPNSKGNCCAISTPSVPLVGSGCLLTYCQLKALKGGLLVVGGGAIFVLGALVMVAYGLNRTPAGKAAKAAVRATPASKLVSGTGSAPRRRSVVAARQQARQATQAKPASDEGDELFEATRGQAARNRSYYRRQMSEPLFTSADADRPPTRPAGWSKPAGQVRPRARRS